MIISSMDQWLSQWEAWPFFYLTLVFVVSLMIGSFLNVVIFRIPKIMEQEFRAECCEFLAVENKHEKTGKVTSLSKPASTCPECKTPIKPWQNIPVLSYLFLKGRCANCKTSISIRYPLVELATALLSLWSVYYFGWNSAGIFSLILLWYLIALTLIDADTYLLPDSLTLPLLWMGLIFNSASLYADLSSAIWGAVIGYGILWSVYWLFKIITGKEGMGFGDFKLLAALGAWMGWQDIPMIIVMSSFVGAVIGIAGILIVGRDKNKPLPFGPYLAIAGWITFIWGDQLHAWYDSYFL